MRAVLREQTVTIFETTKSGKCLVCCVTVCASVLGTITIFLILRFDVVLVRVQAEHESHTVLVNKCLDVLVQTVGKYEL